MTRDGTELKKVAHTEVVDREYCLSGSRSSLLLVHSRYGSNTCSHAQKPTETYSIYANLLEQKKAFAQEKSSTPIGLVWDTNMAAVSLFWDTNMAAVTSCENTLLKYDDPASESSSVVSHNLSLVVCTLCSRPGA